jgi:hypothetical protein
MVLKLYHPQPPRSPNPPPSASRKTAQKSKQQFPGPSLPKTKPLSTSCSKSVKNPPLSPPLTSTARPRSSATATTASAGALAEFSAESSPPKFAARLQYKSPTSRQTVTRRTANTSHTTLSLTNPLLDRDLSPMSGA